MYTSCVDLTWYIFVSLHFQVFYDFNFHESQFGNRTREEIRCTPLSEMEIKCMWHQILIFLNNVIHKTQVFGLKIWLIIYLFIEIT